MSKIRALNEESYSSESDDDTNRKLSKEAQEELAKSKYNQALKVLANGKKKDAAELLEKLLEDPCLQGQQEDSKQCAPFQQQLQLGCMKLLGDLYRDGEFKNLSRSKLMYERAIYIDTEENINLWYRLGKVSYAEGDLHTAHQAFSYALQLRPSHWGSLENIVTICYAVHDYVGCLQHCANGLAKDPKFLKGVVFRDLIYKILPDLKASISKHTKHYAALNGCTEYDSTWKDKYISELRNVEDRARDRILTAKKQISSATTTKISLNLKSLALVEIVKEVMTAYKEAMDDLEFHKIVELTWTVRDAVVEPDEFCKPPATTEESQTEEESQSAVRRSRSSSDDKDTAAATTDGMLTPQQGDSVREKKVIENENSQPLDGHQNNTDGESGNKKKSRGNVKWWQMEGKRRSQRVRGHLMPVSPDKTKKESSFADQLKNLIPTPLLSEEGNGQFGERELAKSPEKNRWQKLSSNYFGTKDEEVHAKQLLSKLSGENLPRIIIRVMQFLTSQIKYPWPVELRELFLTMYKYYRSHVNFPLVQDFEESLVIEDAYISLTYLEIFIEKYKSELNSTSYLSMISEEIFFLEECHEASFSFPKDFILREQWLTTRRLLSIAALLDYEQAYVSATEHLAKMEAVLRQEPVTIWTVNESFNLICLECVTEKSASIAKMQNSQIVTDLYQSQQYESLIGVLQSCINFRDIEKRDLSDIYFYTVALFRTDKSDCIYHSINLMNLAQKYQESNILTKSVLLLDEIWEKMKSQFSLQDKRMAVGSLIKILVACEGKPPPQESVLCIPWCILHSITFSLEREEPALYLEEDTLPNSILLLQMAHECMSRSEKCCVDNGRLMFYTMKAILEVKKLEEYFAYEETRYCMEQAIFCLYSHPGKKSKAKNLKDHNSAGINLTWAMCPTVYQYYCPDELPEFDSYGSIGTEVEGLFQRLLEIMPGDLKPTKKQEKIKVGIETCQELEDSETSTTFPTSIQDIYYLIGDFYFKSKEWAKAVINYTWDLAVVPSRFDSWAAIALSLGENINTTLNTADVIDFKDLLKEAQSTTYCFRNALKFDPANVKLRIEFGSFVYAMHAYCSRLIKQDSASVNMELFQVIEDAKEDFLKSAFKCFEPITKDGKSDANHSSVEDEMWIHHYMLGKINEKMLVKLDAEEFLKQYELAGKLLHDQGAPYPPKMNYYSPPELAIEALEIYYRIHASILTLIDHTEYSVATEKFYLEFLRRQENGPFVKCKQSKGDGAGEGRKGRKATEDAVTKKEQAEIHAVMKHLLENVEKLAEKSVQVSSTSSAVTSTTATEDETSTDSVKSLKATTPPMNSFSLTEFRKRLQERELREEKIASKKLEEQVPTTLPPDIYDVFNLESNPFFEEFKDVKFGAVVAICMKAIEECITRYPSHFKSYYRLAHSYMVFLKDAKKAKEYLMGSPRLSQRKIVGLFGERKANNFFNGIWRNPIDDIDRPGSFSYHMNKTMQLLLGVLSQLNDHQLLVEIVLHLSKVPDNEKKYLSNPDREMFCQQALSRCVSSVRKKIYETGTNYHELGVEVFETYTKLQKQNSRQNPMAVMLHDIYKAHLKSQCITEEVPTVEQAVRYFTFHQMALKASRNNAKNASNQNSDQKISGADGPPRKRGRRAARLASQETVPTTPPPTGQDLDMFNAMSAVFHANNFIESISPLASSYQSTIPSITSLYPKMNLGAVHSAINPLLNNVEIVEPKISNRTPPPAHDSSRGTTKKSQPLPPLTAFSVSNVNVNESQPLSLSQFSKRDPHSSATANANCSNSEKLKIPVSRKRPISSTTSKCPTPPPPPPLHPICLNTSPFKAQRVALEQPPTFQFSKQKGGPPLPNSPVIQFGGRKNPPAAHSNVPPKRRKTVEEPEIGVQVIDLTVKTPDKEPNHSNKVGESEPKAKVVAGTSATDRILPIYNPNPPQVQTKKITSYPLPPKKKHHQILFSTPPREDNNCQDDVEVIILD